MTLSALLKAYFPDYAPVIPTQWLCTHWSIDRMLHTL